MLQFINEMLLSSINDDVSQNISLIRAHDLEAILAEIQSKLVSLLHVTRNPGFRNKKNKYVK